MNTTSRDDLARALRQWRHPREFRIAAPRWQAGVIPALEQIARALDDRDAKVDPGMLAQVATGLWRARRTMLDPGTDDPRPEMRRGFRHVESAVDALAEGGVRILDHTGDPYDSGLELRAIAFEPAPELERERVIETVKPSVYLNGACIQVGEVIVGSPPEATEPRRADAGHGEREGAST